MACYKKGGCGSYEMYSCSECPASKPEYLNKKTPPLEELLSYVGIIPDEYVERSKIVHEDVFKDGVAHLTSEQFEKLYCNICGSQRCEGVDSEWFDGCKFKDHLSR